MKREESNYLVSTEQQRIITVFEAAEVDRSLSREDFKKLEPQIHRLFLSLQQRLRKSNKALIIIVAGVEGAGKGEVVDKLNRWFDCRDVQTHAFWEETDEERQRPRFWRFWRTLPMRGSVSVMFGSWYSTPIVDAVYSRLDEAGLDRELNRISALEKTLSDAGNIIVKLWYHLPKSVQQQRLAADAKVSKFKKSPLLEAFSKSYDAFASVSERALRLTDSEHAPWHIIEASDARYRDISTGDVIVASLQQGLSHGEGNAASVATASEETESSIALIGKALGEKLSGTIVSDMVSGIVLDAVDLSCVLSDAEYRRRLDHLQQKLHALTWQMHDQKRNAVLVFEGWDAAGKGSAIRRVTSAIDARLYRVIPIAAPTDEEKGHHYLWRFWRQIPRAGYATIYDRSWYGRVLVERVEGFARPSEWMRSYQEINDFEAQLVDHGIVLFKFWIHISPDEQLRRFREREADPRKQYKITDEDWRNREMWDDYAAAVNDMVAHTNTVLAPWTLVAGNDKKFARIQILDTLCSGLEAALSAAQG